MRGPRKENIIHGLKVLWGICGLFGLVVVIEDMVRFRKTPELYPIGSENFGWAYASSEHYVLAGWFALSWCLVAVIAALFYRARYSGTVILAHFIRTLLRICYFGATVG